MKKNKVCLLLPAAMAVTVLGFAAASAQAQIAVVNSAGSRAGYPVAPGSLASAYGAFAGAATEAAAALPLPITLGGVMVTVGGLPAPLLYVSEGQINLQIPWGVPVIGSAPGVGPAPIVVNVGGAEVRGVVLTAETDPAIFNLVVHHADGSLNGADNPVNRGGAVIVYGTGIGPVDNTPPDGNPPDGLSTGEQTARAFFGGAEGTVFWSGLAPGFVGLWQLNLQVPAAPYVAGRLPLLVTLGGRPSSNPEVTIYVAE